MMDLMRSFGSGKRCMFSVEARSPKCLQCLPTAMGWQSKTFATEKYSKHAKRSDGSARNLQVRELTNTGTGILRFQRGKSTTGAVRGVTSANKLEFKSS